MQLFQQIARQVRGQPPSPECDGAAVTRICQLVEAMPLGIELAAAWARTRTCTDIALEIERNLGFLATTRRDVPDRHKSMQATFEHSWRLLTAPERDALIKLSVFRRGFLREAAAQVTGASSAVLESLVDKSLLRSANGGRYEMHELLRQYAAEKLSAAPQAQAQAYDRQCAYYAAFVQSHANHLAGAGVAQALAAIKIEIENVRAAWHWAATQTRQAELFNSLDGLSRFYFLTGPYQAGEAAFRLAIEHWRQVERPDRAWRIMLGRLLVEQARFLNAMGMSALALESAQEVIALIAPTSTGGQAACLAAASYLQMGQSLWCQRDYTAARERLDQAATLARAAHTRPAPGPQPLVLRLGNVKDCARSKLTP